jgi:hypothetical protein
MIGPGDFANTVGSIEMGSVALLFRILSPKHNQFFHNQLNIISYNQP